MTDEEKFLEAVCDHPADETPRLTYADWLEGQGRDELADFIRTGMELTKLDTEFPPDKHMTGCGIRCNPGCPADVNRLATGELRRGEEKLWPVVRDSFRFGVPLVGGKTLRKTLRLDRITAEPNFPWLAVSGGFVEGLVISASLFLTYADELFKIHPLREVMFTTDLDWYGRGLNNEICLMPFPLGPTTVLRECKRALYGCWWGKPEGERTATGTVVEEILKVEWPQVKTWRFLAPGIL